MAIVERKNKSADNKAETVLITAIGSFSADIAIKNLKRMGYRVIGCDIYDKKWIADACNVDTFCQVPRATDNAYIDAIKNICTFEGVSYIIISLDVEIDVIMPYREWFEQNDICICLSPNDTLCICRNKLLLKEFADKIDFHIIKTIPTCKLIDCVDVPFAYPMLAKPANGRSSCGIKMINTGAEWTAAKDSDKDGTYIIQPFIEGNVITVDVVNDSTTNHCVAVAREELLRTPNGAGLSVHVFHNQQLEEDCKLLAQKLGIRGCVNFEFIRTCDNHFLLLDCNPRFSGGVEFTCLAGYDCVANHMNAFRNIPIEDFALHDEMYIARKYEEYITAVQRIV